MRHWALATEDELSEAVGQRLLDEPPIKVASLSMHRRQGQGYLRSRMHSWLQMAGHQNVLLVTDLDRLSCASALLDDWLGDRDPPAGLVFRVAVRTIESWILADHEGLRRLLGKKGVLPPRPDELARPKQYLLKLAKLAPGEIRRDLVKQKGAAASQGLGYNARLCEWVRSSWSPARAAQRSPSLQRARQRLRQV